MTRRTTVHALGRSGLLAALAVCFAWSCVGAAPAHAATAPWSPMPAPWGSPWAINDVYAFGATSLATVGNGGHIGVSSDGGRSWNVIVPSGLEATPFTAIAFGMSGRGVVASGALLLVTNDGGITWRTPAYIGPGSGGAINDIALRGSLAVAVGDEGVILSSVDAGATWRRQASPTLSPITSVAIAGDGTAVAGTAAGEILVGVADVWTLAAAVSRPVTSVAASSDPVWGEGGPDLFAATGSDVLGSDDALTFASLPGLPDLSSQPWPSLAWSGVPERSLLIANALSAGFFEPLSRLWRPGLTGLAGASHAVAPGGQSVAYLLDSNGLLVRTLSAGRKPATVQLSRSRVLIGASTRLTATVRIGAPGVLLLRQRVPGRPWETARTVTWTPGDWSRSLAFVLKPALTHEYRLAFKYGEAAVDLAAAVRVVVVPKIDTTRSAFDLRVGRAYRFSGSVTPALRGERVGLFTDRGGSWRPVSLQGSVALVGGRTWASRPFGTPKAETYHLRAHLAGTSTHAEAWSRVVTVRIR